MNFQDYYNTCSVGSMNLNSYRGIKKSENPKWLGWKEIQRCKLLNEPIENDYLDTLVYNFYLCEFILNKLYVDYKDI